MEGYLTGICLERLRNYQEVFSHGNKCLDRDSNRLPSENKLELLPLQQTWRNNGYTFVQLLTLILLTWTIWRAPTNASKWRMGFNSAFEGLIRVISKFLNFSLILLNSTQWIRFPLHLKYHRQKKNNLNTDLQRNQGKIYHRIRDYSATISNLHSFITAHSSVERNQSVEET